jgi:uncharacterized membrane protein
LEISREDLERLLDQVRELRSRVDRLERLVNASEAPKKPAESETSWPTMPETQAASNPRPTVTPRQMHWSRYQASNLEARIGSHWLNRVGIAAFLTAVAYFLKFAFENNWLGPSARVATGVIAGILIVIWSERFRTRGYLIFSYSLKAIGIGALYLSLWASFQLYHLFPFTIVFLCMVGVTGTACVMALAENAEILAWFAIAGGFSTPLLLATGENREIALFSYLVLLDLGVVALVVRRPWGRLLLLGFCGTLILYLTWYLEFYDIRQRETTFVFASIFFVTFALAPLVTTSRPPEGEVTRIAIAVLNAVTYFLQAYVMLMDSNRAAMAGFTVLIAAGYLVIENFEGTARGLEVGKKLRRVHLALALGFITIAIPIRFENYWVTLGWLVEAGVLLGVGSRIRSDLAYTCALAALLMAIARLLFIDNFEPGHLILSLRSCLYGLAILLVAAVAHYGSKRSDEVGWTIGRVAAVLMNILALRALSLEVRDYYSGQLQLIHPAPAGGVIRAAQQVRSIQIARDFTYSALWMTYGAMLMAIGFWRASAFVRWQALVIIAVTTTKIFLYDTSQLDRIYRILSFAVLGMILLVISFAYQRDWLRFDQRAIRS